MIPAINPKTNPILTEDFTVVDQLFLLIVK